MAISAKDVSALRQRTGLGMMECKQALTEADGNLDEAVNLLRQKGLAKMDQRTDREAAEGKVAAAVSDDGTTAALVEVNAETDFTAGNDEFKAMMQTVANEALKQSPGDVSLTDEMQAAIDEVRITTKENVNFNRGKVLGGQGKRVGSYVHFTGKIGVLVEVEGSADDDLLKDLCMHVSAISPAPLGLTEDEVPADRLEQEREMAAQQAREQGKPENIIEKIVEGKVRKFYDDHVLPRQPFVKDDKKQVKDLLPEGVAITGYVRYAIGQA
jgi:elongation factor Ts